MSYKISAITWSYHFSVELGKYDDMALIDIYSNKLKIGAIEFIVEHLKSSKKEHLLKLKKYATDKGLIISAVSPGNNFGAEKDSDRRKQLDYVKKSVDTAEILGTNIVRVFAGWPPQDKKEALWGKMIESMKEAANYASKKGITLAVEPHNNGGFLPDSGTTLRMLKDVNSPYVKLNIDTGNYQDKDMYAAIERTVEYAASCHVKVHTISKSGKIAQFDMDKIFKILSRNNYRGFLALEYEGQEFIKGEKKDKADNEDIFVPIAVDAIKKMVRRYY